eukprot:4982788-Prymnesium_polylepis.1
MHAVHSTKRSFNSTPNDHSASSGASSHLRILLSHPMEERRQILRSGLCLALLRRSSRRSFAAPDDDDVPDDYKALRVAVRSWSPSDHGA